MFLACFHRPACLFLSRYLATLARICFKLLQQGGLLPFTDGVAVIVLKCLNSRLKKRKLINSLTTLIHLQCYHWTFNVSSSEQLHKAHAVFYCFHVKSQLASLQRDLLESDRMPGQVSIVPDTQVRAHGHDTVHNAGHCHKGYSGRVCYVSSVVYNQRRSTIVETDHSDHFEWGNLRRQRWRISRPFHQQPITCVVTAEPGKL